MMGNSSGEPRSAGPYRTVGVDNVFYMLQFDKHGATVAPETLKHARNMLRTGGFTDVYFLCHGWNNLWESAVRRYNSFVDGVVDQTPDDPMRRALLLGIFWPSAALVLPGERAPEMAAGAGASPGFDEPARSEVTAELSADAATRVEELAARDELDTQDATQLAELLAPLYGDGIDELGEDGGPPAPDALVRSWRQNPPVIAEKEDDDREWGTADDVRPGPRSAGFVDKLDPRAIIRGASVWVMKDRAGRIGTAAVGPLVREALAETETQVHLVGHSFGAKVTLSAICAEPLPRRVHSLLLLQPAVNHLCFAERVPGRDRTGGYRPALERVQRQILTTYSALDTPLTQFFHWALRRDSDLGEPQTAAWPEPPSDYAALGGFGPHGADVATQWAKLQRPGQPYNFDPQRRITAVDATAGISSHSDVSNPWTWWALRELVA